MVNAALAFLGKSMEKKKKKLSGFAKLMAKKIKAKKEREAREAGNPSWAKKLRGSDKARYEAVKRANEKKKKMYE